MKLILASQSPRRRELMAMVAADFSVRVSQAEEDLPPDIAPGAAVEELALRKALAVRQALAGENIDPDGCVIVGSDTVVAIDGRVLGKPHSREECLAMLAALSGREHTVHTGVALVNGQRRRVFRQTAQVEFWPLPQPVMDWYSSTDEPYDKAGGYGVQGLGALLVKAVRGDYYTVMGLPVSGLWRQLRDFAPDIPSLIGPPPENLRN